jgi:hypothetical protein
LVALQEVSGGMVKPLRHGLSRAGFGHVVENADLAARAGRPNSLLIGSRCRHTAGERTMTDDADDMTQVSRAS